MAICTSVKGKQRHQLINVINWTQKYSVTLSSLSVHCFGIVDAAPKVLGVQREINSQVANSKGTVVRT